MIYFDNAATTLHKPDEVATAAAYAINHLGNAGRGAYDAAMEAARAVYQTRAAIATLVGLEEPLNVAFTSSATESFGLLFSGLLSRGDRVITTAFEHNSVLRPLYLLGCEVRVMPFLSEKSSKSYEDLDLVTFATMLESQPKLVVATHASNVTGAILPVYEVYAKCKAKGIPFILDIAQTLGTIPVSVDMADAFVFTGHKGLYGPQGTGGIIIANEDLLLKEHLHIVKTGGTGTESFAPLQPYAMPDIFEAGTANAHGLYALQRGVKYVSRMGVEAMYAHEMKLWQALYEGLKAIPEVELYGVGDNQSCVNQSDEGDDYHQNDANQSVNGLCFKQLPILAFNIRGMDSAEVASLLWEEYGIALRSGSHCAPLLHDVFDTKERGIVRVSFSFFNQMSEVNHLLKAILSIISDLNN